METILIYGASDDLIEVAGCDGADEFNHYEREPWVGDLVAPDGSAMRVHVLFDGCWHVAVGQVAEDRPFPGWHTLTVMPGAEQIPAYSTGLLVHAPEGTKLVTGAEPDGR